MAKNFYEILGVSKDASDEEIKKSYRRLAKQYHPDVNKGDKKAEERFKEISEAYETLSNSEKKKQYDMFGASGAGFDPSQWGGAGAGGASWGGRGAGGYEDLGDIFRQAGGRGKSKRGGGAQFSQEDFANIFGDIFGAGGRSQNTYQDWGGAQEKAAPKKGRDLYYSMELDFMEAAKGTTSKISIHRDGKLEKIDVKIPSGVNNGSKIRLAGKGEDGPRGGSAGDLYIEIKVKPHRLFWREGNDVFLEAPLSVGEAILGASIKVPTLEGHANIKVPAGTASGQKMRLKEKGIKSADKKTPGDMYVMISIVPPKAIDHRSRELIEEFEKLNRAELRKDF